MSVYRVVGLSDFKIYHNNKLIGELQQYDRIHKVFCFFNSEKHFVAFIDRTDAKFNDTDYKKRKAIYLIEKKLQELEQIENICFIETVNYIELV